jgi:WD40 repeat protein
MPRRLCPVRAVVLALVTTIIPIWLFSDDAGTARDKPELIVQRGEQNGLVEALSVSPDGAWLLTGNSGGSAKLINLSTGNQVRAFSCGPNSVMAVALSSATQFLAVGDLKGTVCVWLGASGSEQFVGKGNSPVSAMGFSPSSPEMLLVGYENGHLDLFDVQKKIVFQSTELADEILSLSFDRTGRHFVAAGRKSGLHLFETLKFQEVRQYRPPEPAYSVAFNDGGSRFAAGLEDGTVCVYPISKNSVCTPSLVSNGTVMGLVFTNVHDDLAAASLDGSVVNLKSLPLAATTRFILETKIAPHLYTMMGRWPMALSEAGGLLVYSPDGNFLRVQRLGSGEALKDLGSLTTSVTSLALSPNGSQLATGDHEGRISVWNLQKGEPGQILESEKLHIERPGATISALAFSPDGHRLGSGGVNTPLTIWNLDSGAKDANPFYDQVTSVTFTSDGSSLISSNWSDNTARLWDLQLNDGRPLTRHIFGPEGAFLSSDGRQLLSGGPRELDIFDFQLGNVKRFSVDANAIAPGVRGIFPTAALNIVVRKEGTAQSLFSLPGHSKTVRAMAMAPDGLHLVSSSLDGTTKLWSLVGQRELGTYNGHSALVDSLAITPDGSKLITGGEDGTAKVWTLESREELASVLSLGRQDWVVVSPDGWFDGTADGLAQVSWRIGKSNVVVPLDHLYNEFFRPGLLAEAIGHNQVPPPKRTISELLALPGTQTMVEQGLARVSKGDTQLILCIPSGMSMDDLASKESTLGLYKLGERLDMASFGFVENHGDPTCKYRKEVPNDGATYEFVASGKTEFPQPQDVEKTFSDVKSAKLLILTVAIDAYPKGSPYPPLVYSAADADAIEKFFLDQQGSKKGPFKSVEVKHLRDSQATREGIRDALADLAGTATEDDVVLLFFSGHGKIPSGQEMFYFIPYFKTDAWGMNAFEESREAVATSIFVEAIRKLRSRRIVFVLDACESGGALESLRKIADVKWKIENSGSETPSIKAADGGNSVRTGIYIIAAASPIDQAVQARQENHGLLTYVILQALGGNAIPAESPVTITDVVNFVRKNLPDVAKGHNEPQTPLIVGVGPANFPLTPQSK